MSDAGDDDLVDDFLAAAGLGDADSDAEAPASPPKSSPKKRKSVSKPSTSKSKRQKRSSDSSESELGEISEDELDDITSITPQPRSRRRNDPSPDDEESFENPYPLEGKYRDEQDRERLMNMTEVEREGVLSNRYEEMKRLKEKRELAEVMSRHSKDQPRRSGREGQLRSEKAGKRDELTELKKRREEKSNAAKVRTPTKPKFVVDEEEESSAESGQLSDVDVKRVDESSTRITSENVRPITLTREFFSRYCYYPQFESAITGCFTRVRISEKDNDYRFARIEGLVTVSKYSVEGVPVDQGLELSQGGTKKVINMDFASNSPITQREFDRYVGMLSTARGSIASRKHLDRKTKDIKEMQEYKLTDADITAMIAKKKSLTRIPKNLVHEKTRLKQLLLTAMSNGNESEVENVQDQLAQLEELAQGNRDKSISRESEMFRKVNERNRKMNMVEMREAERREAEERKKNALSMDASVVDPFSRRKTIPKTFYDNLVSSRGGSPAPSSGVNTPTLAPTSAAVPEMLVLDAVAKVEKDTTNGKVVKVEDVIAQADFGIDIEI